MPLLIKGKTTCAISGKVISEGDAFLCFPQFPCAPHDPAVICQDACVLRDEFERWEFKDNVTRKVKAFWSMDYGLARAFTVVFEDDAYLIVKSEVEGKVRILFLQHVFIIDVPGIMWRKFCKMILSNFETIRISPYPNVMLSFSRETEKIKVCLHVQRSGHDCIEIPWPEWSHFQSVLSVNERLFV